VYPILIEATFGLNRQTVQQRLKENGIETRRFFSPLHLQPIMTKAGIRRSFARSVEIADKGLYLPSYIGMDSGTIRRVASDLVRLAA
jgi:perosamine synthetase